MIGGYSKNCKSVCRVYTCYLLVATTRVLQSYWPLGVCVKGKGRDVIRQIGWMENARGVC